MADQGEPDPYETSSSSAKRRQDRTEREEEPPSALPGFLGTIDTIIARVEALVLAAGVLLMAANTIANVVSRFVFQYGLYFTGEVNRILIILITFAGLGYAARMGRHIRMSALFDVMNVPGRKGMMVFIACVTSIVMFALCYFSVGYIGQVQSSGRVLPALQIPVYWIYLWAPVGFAITGIQYALTAVKNLTSRDVYLSTSVLEGYEKDETEV